MGAPAVSSRLRRPLAFLVSGGSGFALYYVLALLLARYTGLGAGTVAFLAVVLSIPSTFLLQKHFAFRARDRLLPSLARYCLLQGVNAVAIGLLARAGRHAGLPDALNFLASASFVVAVSYLALSRFVFRR